MARSISFGPFRLDLANKQLWRDGAPVNLTPRAIDVLIYLAQNAGEVVTREQLFQAVWPGVHVADHALSVQIRDIRKALEDDIHDSRYIETRHKRGYCFKAPIASNEAPSVPETHYVESSGGVNIAYQVIGEGPVDLVFVMGWVSNVEYFWTEPRCARFLRRLSEFSRVILFDKRGTGLSDRVPLNQLPTIEQRMEDVHAVLNEIGSKRAVICGVSEGGCMSAVFAATHPERTLALVMIGAYARRRWAEDYPWAPSPEARQVLLQEIRQHWGKPVGLEERAPSVAADPQFREWWASYLRMGASPGAALALTIMNTETDIRYILPLVRVPTLVLHRSGDLCLKVEEGRYIASRIPGAHFVELPGNDHLPFVGDQESILREIESFLAEVQSAISDETVLATVLDAEFRTDTAVDAGIVALFDCFRARHVQRTHRRITAAFDGPARAIQCAITVQTKAATLGMPSRIGLHTGEFLSQAGSSISGEAVAIASLIRDRAAWDQILASGVVQDLIAGSGIAFEPHGRVRASGFDEWQVLEVHTPVTSTP